MSLPKPDAEPSMQSSSGLTQEQLDAAFKALASEQRRDILRLLASCCPVDKTCCTEQEDVCACRISEQLGLAPSTISHHMGILREAGLVSARKEGTWVHYALIREALRAVSDELLGL